MRKYKDISDGMSKVIEVIENDGTIRFIPICEANSDYQRYLRWLEDPTAEDEAQSL